LPVLIDLHFLDLELLGMRNYYYTNSTNIICMVCVQQSTPHVCIITFARRR